VAAVELQSFSFPVVIAFGNRPSNGSADRRKSVPGCRKPALAGPQILSSEEREAAPFSGRIVMSHYHAYGRFTNDVGCTSWNWTSFDREAAVNDDREPLRHAVK
jgi:hypothetical protein